MSVIIKLTDRAHEDLQDIEAYSRQRWGQKTADRYLRDVQTALSLLQEHPDLLSQKVNISSHFQFYRVRDHFLVCLKLNDTLFVLTIKHGQMDLPDRLADLTPTLLQEASLLHRRLLDAEKTRHKARIKK